MKTLSIVLNILSICSIIMLFATDVATSPKEPVIIFAYIIVFIINIILVISFIKLMRSSSKKPIKIKEDNPLIHSSVTFMLKDSEETPTFDITYHSNEDLEHCIKHIIMTEFPINSVATYSINY